MNNIMKLENTVKTQVPLSNKNHVFDHFLTALQTAKAPRKAKQWVNLNTYDNYTSELPNRRRWLHFQRPSSIHGFLLPWGLAVQKPMEAGCCLQIWGAPPPIFFTNTALPIKATYPSNLKLWFLDGTSVY